MPKESIALPLNGARLRPKVPLSQPLRHVRYRQLWLANLISNLGTWMQTFASAWLVTTVANSASTSSLVQTAAYVPVFLFALFAGVIADRVDRPKFLFFCNLTMALCACVMAAVVASEQASAGPVLALTFLMGACSAFMWPAWQACMSGLVEADEVEAAATLNNLSYNVAAVAGPALGGLLFGLVGASALFLINALSFLGLLGVYWSWWRTPRAAQATVSASFGASLRTGLQTAFGCPRYRRILANVCTVFFASIAFASLLPVFVKTELGLDSSVFGVLMGSLGAGAVLGACLLPHLRPYVSKTGLLGGALLVFGSMLVALPFLRSVGVMVPLIVAGGMAWSATVSTMNAAAQLAFPQAVRARTLSIYLLVMAAAYTVGSVVWGFVADQFGVRAALAAAGACILVNGVLLLTAQRENAI